MRGTLAAMTATVALLIAPVRLSAKGDTVRITITGGDLAAPIEITDPAVAARFHVWSGPGTSSSEAHGLNIDWSRGVVEAPKGLPDLRGLVCDDAPEPQYLRGALCNRLFHQPGVRVPSRQNGRRLS